MPPTGGYALMAELAMRTASSRTFSVTISRETVPNAESGTHGSWTKRASAFEQLDVLAE